jgi:hypothetical protein
MLHSRMMVANYSNFLGPDKNSSTQCIVPRLKLLCVCISHAKLKVLSHHIFHSNTHPANAQPIVSKFVGTIPRPEEVAALIHSLTRFTLSRSTYKGT